MNHWYVDRIMSERKRNEEISHIVLKHYLGKVPTRKELEEIEDDKLLSEIYITMSNKIDEYESPYSIEKLTYAIQHSRSGAGGCAITKYTCSFCGEEDSWLNTAVPKICKKCAENMAKSIVRYKFKLLKD